MHHASSDPVHVERVEVHESHAAEKENSSAQIGKRLIGGRNVHFQNGFHQGENADFFSD